MGPSYPANLRGLSPPRSLQTSHKRDLRNASRDPPPSEMLSILNRKVCDVRGGHTCENALFVSKILVVGSGC